jgi:hypothetical protein
MNDTLQRKALKNQLKVHHLNNIVNRARLECHNNNSNRKRLASITYKDRIVDLK